MMNPRDLPAGTVTFLFSDIEGSTRLLQALGPRYTDLLEEHRRLVREAIAAEGGHEVNTEGDSFFIVFSGAVRAAVAAGEAQRALGAFPWPEGLPFRARMGLHTGDAVPVGRDYVGLDVHRAARICAAGHGGQILVSQATKELIEDGLPEGFDLRDLGPHRLKDLSRPEHLFQLTAPDLPVAFPPLHTLEVIPNNLPIQLTSFVGRRQELSEARRLLDGTRLLTLTGPGGTGKTRLAMQLAAEVVDHFPDGVFFVPLAPLTDPDLVASTIAQSLDVRESGGRPILDRLREYMDGKSLLLILDNFEQVVAAAPVVSELLKAGARVKTIATTRIPLHITGEQEFPVPPLRRPDPRHAPDLDSLSQYEAVTLFIQRAVAVKPDFTITNENAPAVAEIASRLDGLPLAIELAAARVKLFPPQAMLARLQRRLSFLSGGPRDLPARQQTLRDAIAWSYDLLDDGGRRLLARMAVFVGGCGLEQAEAVCGPAEDLGRDLLDGLAGLVDQSLLRQEEVEGEPRFVMLETIREFALERLEASGEAEEIHRRHTAAYLAFAEQASPHLAGPQRITWLDRLEREHDNLRAAIAWAIEHADAETSLRLGAALWRFWQMRGYLHEARERLTKILAVPGASSFGQAHAQALEAAGGIAYWQGDMDAARRFYEERLALRRDLGERLDIAAALYDLAFVFIVPQKEVERGRAFLDESLTIYEEAGDRAGIAKVHWAMASVTYTAGDYPASFKHLEICIPIFRAFDDRFSLGWALHSLGLATSKTGDYPAARKAFDEAMGLFSEARDISGMALLLLDFSGLALLEGDRERAARLAGGAATLQKSGGVDLASIVDATEGPWQVGGQLDRQALAAAIDEGRAMTMEEIVAYALRRSPRADAG